MPKKLKFRLTEAAYNKLTDDEKDMYTDDGEGSFTLNVEGIEDAAALRRARDREKERAKELQAQVDTLTDEVATLTDENKTLKAKTGNDKDIERLEKSWTDKLTEAETKAAEREAKLTGFVDKLLREAKATELATKISTAPKVMQRHLMDRLTVNHDGDEPELVVLDKAGKPSKMTLDQLGEEFVADKDYSAIIRGSKASGSVTPPGTPPAGGTGGQSQDNVNLATMRGKDLAAHIKATKEQQAAAE